MNNKSIKKIKLFDLGVLKDGFRNLKLPGILFLVIFCIRPVIYFIRCLIIKNTSSGSSGSDIMGGIGYSLFSNGFYLLFHTAFFLSAAVLTLITYRFLTKRNASDIYHSLPYKRETIFISLFTSITAWLAIISFGTSLLSLIFNLIIGETNIAFLSLFIYTLGSFISLILIAACFSIAVTITGRLGNSILVGLLITFVPRLFITEITNSITASLPILSSSNLSFFLDNNNLVTSIYSLFGNRYSYSESIGPCIYTFVLALIYFVIACVLFRFRKSENASQSVPNKKLQAIYRICLCMAICIIIISSLFENINNNTPLYSTVVWYVIAIVVYFAYELITTRSFKSLLKALPGLGIVVILNIAVYGIMAGVRSYELNYCPESEDIKSVAVSMRSLSLDSDYYDNYEYYTKYIHGYKQYIDAKSIDIDLQDEEIISIVADNLKENIDVLQKSKKRYINTFKNHGDEYDKYILATVKINSGFASKYRKIYIPKDKMIDIKDAYCNNSEYREMFTTLPKISNAILYLYIDNNIVMKISEDTLDTIYEKAREEISAYDFDTLHEELNKISESNFLLRCSFHENTEYYTIKTPINYDLTPQAYVMLLEKFYSESSSDREKIVRILVSDNKIRNKYKINMTFFNEDGRYSTWRSDYNYNNKSIEFVNEHKKDCAPKIGDSYVIITVNENSTDEIQAIINMGDATLEDFN